MHSYAGIYTPSVTMPCCPPQGHKTDGLSVMLGHSPEHFQTALLRNVRIGHKPPQRPSCGDLQADADGPVMK